MEAQFLCKGDHKSSGGLCLHPKWDGERWFCPFKAEVKRMISGATLHLMSAARKERGQ